MIGGVAFNWLMGSRWGHMALTCAIGVVLGAWAAAALVSDRVALVEAQAALQAAQVDLADERAETARLGDLLDIERDRATAARFASAEAERVNLEASARLEAMEDLIDEIYATPGADAPAHPVLVDALDRVLRTGGGGDPAP